MTEYSFEVFVYVGADCLFVFIGLLVLFAFNGEDIPAGFRLWPISSREWRVLYFHTLEALLLVSFWLGCVGYGKYFMWSFPVTLYAYGLLLFSAFVVWRWDRSLCYRELWFCLISFILGIILLPMANATME